MDTPFFCTVCSSHSEMASACALDRPCRQTRHCALLRITLDPLSALLRVRIHADTQLGALGRAITTAACNRVTRKRTPMHQGACHCGAVKLKLPSTPTVATSCNCSLCRRIGGPSAYFEFGTVEMEGHPENTAEYIQGDKTLRTIRCRTCGCVTHWEPLQLTPGAKHGVHLGNS